MSNSQTLVDLATRIRPAIVTHARCTSDGKLQFRANSFENGEPHSIPVVVDYDPGLTLAGNHAFAALSLMKDREWYADYNLVMGDGEDDSFVFVQIPVER